MSSVMGVRCGRSKLTLLVMCLMLEDIQRPTLMERPLAMAYNMRACEWVISIKWDVGHSLAHNKWCQIFISVSNSLVMDVVLMSLNTVHCTTLPQITLVTSSNSMVLSKVAMIMTAAPGGLQNFCHPFLSMTKQMNGKWCGSTSKPCSFNLALLVTESWNRVSTSINTNLFASENDEEDPLARLTVRFNGILLNR